MSKHLTVIGCVVVAASAGVAVAFVDPVSRGSTRLLNQIAESKKIPAQIDYQVHSLIAVTSEGVAAFQFDEPFDDNSGKGIAYHHRYLAGNSKAETTGKSTAFEKREVLPNGQPGDLGGKRYLKAGKVSVEWSLGGPDRGYVYYAPENVAVLIVNRELFDNDARLDLSRFRRLPRP